MSQIARSVRSIKILIRTIKMRRQFYHYKQKILTSEVNETNYLIIFHLLDMHNREL